MSKNSTPRLHLTKPTASLLSIYCCIQARVVSPRCQQLSQGCYSHWGQLAHLTKLHLFVNTTDNTATWTNKIIIRKVLELVELLCRQLGRLICEVGMLVTKACDKYVATKNATFQQGRLLQSIQNSSCHKVCFLLIMLCSFQS